MQGTRKILVLNLPPSIHEDYLELFFENTKQYGGGPVVNATIDKEKLTAIVEFETPDAVDKVLAKGNIQIMNQLVQVTKYNREELFIIEVKGPPSIVCEDNIEFLQLYFEHAKSNGGKVQTIKFDRGRNSALITFESIEVAERVLQHNHKLKQQSLIVQKFDPLPMISIGKRIRVKGVSDCGSEDALRFYFENKRRSGGGSIADIQMFHETNEAVITFENIADATSVLEKEHRLNNKTIEVSKYIPDELRPFYPDRLLIHGVKSTSSDESLANLIEAKLGTGVRQFAYHKDRDDVVLVYLQTSFDLKNTQYKIKGWSLDEAELEVFEVPVTDCILVENIPDLILEETMGLYFDNARRSGGGNVKKTVMNADNRTCVVYFEDYSAVENVMAKEHIIYGEKLRVDRYLDCLCLSETNALDTSAPSSLVLCADNYQIQNFISKSEVFQQKLENELKHLCAGLERNEAEKQTLVVFTPGKGVVSNKFQRHWKEKVLRTIAKEEADIQIQHKQVSDTDIQNILKQVSRKERNSDNVCISFDQTNGIVSIVGFIGYIDLTMRFIDAVSDVKIKSMETNEERVSDFLTINNHLEMNMLQKLGFPDELKEKYPKLKVFINETEDQMCFDGSQNDIRDAKLHVLETKLLITCIDYRLSESAMKLLSTEETKDYISSKLKKVNTSCEWRVQNQRLSVCCSGNSDANIIADIILLSVNERSLSLKPEVVSISVSEMLTNIETELKERYKGRFVMHICDKTLVQLYSTEDISLEIYADLQKLVQMEETRYIDELQHASEELMSLSAEDELQQASDELKLLPGTTLSEGTHFEQVIMKTGTNEIRFIKRHMKKRIEDIEKYITKSKVTILLTDDAVVIRGSSEGIARAKDVVTQMLYSIIVENYTIQMVAAKDVIRTETGSRKIDLIENLTKCIIHIPEQTENEFNIRGIKLRVIVGNILDQKTDVIVCSVDNNFSGGEVADQLKTRCPGLEENCKKKIQNLKSEGAVLTGSFGLPASSVVHVQYAQSAGEWKKKIMKCLELANNRKAKTIAFPILGTGKACRTFSPEAMAECFYEAVTEIVDAFKKTTIKEVRLIVYKGQPLMLDVILKKLHLRLQETVKGSLDHSWHTAFSKGAKKIKQYAANWYAANWFTDIDPETMSAIERRQYFSKSSSLELAIYSDNKLNIDQCKRALDAKLKLENAYTEKKIDQYKELITTVTTEELKELDMVAWANINIDREGGVITVEGPTKPVSDAVHELQMRLLKIERRRHDITAAEELFKIVQWHYEECIDTELKPVAYAKLLNHKIEQAYKKQDRMFEFTDDDGVTFVIDFQNLVEYPKGNKDDSLRVIRKDILKAATSKLPDDWTQMKDTENIKVVTLQATDPAYKAVETRFMTEVKTGSYSHRYTFNVNNLQINKIERIQNKTLYMQFMAKRKQMTEQKPNLPANMPIERELWHGTKNYATMHGFNRSYSGNANGDPWFGEGVYFAGDASYSARGWLSGAGSGGKGYMFLVKTLTGQFCQGVKKMRYLPPVDAKNATVLYDCAVDNPANPLEFVIFNDTQAYPAYIITFQT